MFYKSMSAGREGGREMTVVQEVIPVETHLEFVLLYVSHFCVQHIYSKVSSSDLG